MKRLLITSAAAIALGLSLAAATPASAQLMDPFSAGLTDRTHWEQWIHSLPAGSYHDGALYWSGQRSLRVNRGTCESSIPDFEQGCEDAKRMLDPMDYARTTDERYHAGWNAYSAPAPVATVAGPPMIIPQPWTAPVQTPQPWTAPVQTPSPAPVPTVTGPPMSVPQPSTAPVQTPQPAPVPTVTGPPMSVPQPSTTPVQTPQPWTAPMQERLHCNADATVCRTEPEPSTAPVQTPSPTGVFAESVTLCARQSGIQAFVLNGDENQVEMLGTQSGLFAFRACMNSTGYPLTHTSR